MAAFHSEYLSSGKKRALLIAVRNNGVGGFPTLYHAHPDAKETQRLLIEVYGYTKDDIILMMDHKSIPKELWPTRKNIRKQIQLFVQGVSTGDRLFFYYSGHGHQVPCYHHTEQDGLDEEIYTCNGKEIMDNDLRKWLVDPLPRGCRLFVIEFTSVNANRHYGIHVTPKQYLTLIITFAMNPEAGNARDNVTNLALCRHFGEFFRGNSVWFIFKPVISSHSDLHSGTNAIRPLPRRTFIIASHEHRGRPASQASVSISAISAGNSPLLPFSKWMPFMEGIERVLSPPPLYKCNGKCSLPTEGDAKYAYVISLSACKDNEIAVDDRYNGTVTRFFIDHLRAKPKSTLRELLLAIRQRVDEITAARQAWDTKTRVISRQVTFTSGSKIKTEWTPQIIRRSTEINVDSVEEFLQFKPSGAHVEGENTRYSQKPSYSSHYRLNLDELVDL